MAGQSICSLHIQKLGHHLEEIRIRALHSLLSKLNCGFIEDRELASRPELLKKLLDWFGFDNVSEEEKVLELILRILKADEGGDLLMLLKMPDATKLLDKIKEKISDSKGLGLLGQICEMTSSFRGSDVPPTGSRGSPDHGSETSGVATTFELFICENEVDQMTGVSKESSDVRRTGGSVPPDQLRASLPRPALQWQPLCPTDRHVLAATEESLARAPAPACRFLRDVMLQDFPAEVFLQRPRTVQLLLKLLEPGSDRSLHSSVLKCLYDLTVKLRVRVEFSNDPCVHSLKQELDQSSLTPGSGSARSSASCGEGGPTAGQYLQGCDLGWASPRRAPGGDHEDELLLRLRQLGLPQFCLLALEAAILLVPTSGSGEAFSLVWSLADLLSTCATASLWLSTDSVAQEVSQMAKNVFVSLGDALDHCRRGCRLSYLQLLSVAPELLSHLALPDLDLADAAVPIKTQLLLADAVFDYALAELYPRLHSELLRHLQMFSDRKVQERLQLYSGATKFCASLKATAQLLNSSSELSGREFVSVLESALLSLPVHGNMSVVKHALDIYFSRAHSWYSDEEVWKQSSNVLLRLFAHAETRVRQETYKSCHGHVVVALGVGHASFPQAANHAVQLFDTPLLVEVMCHGASSPNKEIQRYAEEMLIHLLKGKFLMSDQMWRKFVESLIPTFPLLLCYATKATALGRAITKMLDPDVSSTILLPDFVVFKGNLCLLFLLDRPSQRQEAAARLAWLLAKQPRSSDLLPDLSAVSAVEIGHIFLMDEPPVTFRVDPRQVFYEPGDLCQVLELLESGFVEPAVRRSALTQAAVMLRDPRLHAVFLQQEGLPLVLQLLRSALSRNDCTNSSESLVPIISILRSLAHHNSTVRQELALLESVFDCVLRAGLMFAERRHHRAAAVHLLCLLLYADYLLPAPPSASEDGADLSLPRLVVDTARLPFRSASHWGTSPHARPSCTDVARDEKVRRLLSLRWSAECSGGVATLLGTQVLPGGTEELCATPADLVALRQSSVTLTCRESLQAISDANTHITVYKHLHILTGYAWLQMATDDCEENEWHELPWEQTFCRFLTTRPASVKDERLLAAVLDFLCLHLRAFPREEPPGAERSWLEGRLRAPDGPLLVLLEKAGGNGGEEGPDRELCRAALQLCEECCVARGWAPVVRALTRCLCCSDSQYFYNLALLAWTLSCLTHVTSRAGWSDGAAEWRELAGCLCTLVTAFHCNAGAGSFMGLSVTCGAVLCLNHLLAEMHRCVQEKEWTEAWLLTLGEAYQLWLPSLWQCRDPMVRAGSLQLLAGLCVSHRLCTMLLASFNLVSVALGFVADHRETSLVREQAAVLLTNITSHKSRMPPSPSGDRLQDLGEALQRHSFYRELAMVLSGLRLGDRSLGRRRVESLSGRRLPPGDQIALVCEALPGQVHASSKPESEVSGSETDDTYSSMVTSPSLVGACCWLLLNLLMVDERHTLANIMEHGIIAMMFVCLGSPFSLADCAASLRADLAEMRTAACNVLCKCVALSDACRAAVLRLSGCLRSLLLLVNPADYRMDSERILLLRDRLWSAVFRLLSALMAPGDLRRDGFEAVRGALIGDGRARFLQALRLSLAEDACPDLRSSSLVSLASLLAPQVADVAAERRDDVDGGIGSVSVQSLLDTCRTADTSTSGSSASDAEGAELCELLLRLLDAHLRQHKCGGLGKGSVVSALSGLLAASHAAKRCALQHGLHRTLLSRARDLQLRLSLDSAECLRRLSHKRRGRNDGQICPVLDDLRVLLGVATNFMVCSGSVKAAMAEAGLADLVHKAWVWCAVVPSFMAEMLRLLCTLTTDCLPGCHSLVLTTTVPGLGPRKAPSAASLLHVVAALVQGELEAVSHNRDLRTLELAFQLLQNATHSQECRLVLIKCGLLQSFLLLHPSHTKGQRCWEPVETLWLGFLADLTFHRDAQLALPKQVPDCLELLLWLAGCPRRESCLLALAVLRNLAFHRLNRPRLLASAGFLRALSRALSDEAGGGVEEAGLAATAVWALVANSQKAKLAVRRCGLVSLLRAAVGRMGARPHTQCVAVRVAEHVLGLLEPGES
ncbi:rotatin isoform X3 [Bacillus rossius redtenbacheri]|uniref:rotatin isoform X3 n=1 Tax=Bacillus rossius redtenbacheri TaxID=93214 RepID=UPI002FDC7A92